MRLRRNSRLEDCYVVDLIPNCWNWIGYIRPDGYGIRRVLKHIVMLGMSTQTRIHI